jgi:circadian clock protein KaiB
MATATGAESAVSVADLKRAAKAPMILRLYVAGDAPNSTRARANLRRILTDVDPSYYRLEVIDCLEEPLRALDDGVLVTPTLVRIQPQPSQTVVGSLSALDRVADALEIDAISLSPGQGTTDE